jgi:hypothetical protein
VPAYFPSRYIYPMLMYIIHNNNRNLFRCLRRFYIKGLSLKPMSCTQLFMHCTPYNITGFESMDLIHLCENWAQGRSLEKTAIFWVLQRSWQAHSFPTRIVFHVHSYNLIRALHTYNSELQVIIALHKSTIIPTSLLIFLKPTVVVAWLWSSNKGPTPYPPNQDRAALTIAS